MFCPYCGTESTQGLNYCKRCGANLGAGLQAGAAQDARPAISNGTAWAAGISTTAVVVIGLGIIFPITTELTSHGMNSGTVAAIALVIALAVFGCTAMLLRFWSSLLGVGRPAARKSLMPPAVAPTGELGASRLDALNPQSAPSITEQTTRTLEHVEKKY
jgi:hypothetical protein